MSIHELKRLLAASADDVRQVDVHSGAIRRSRRAGLNRVAITTVAVLAVAIGGVAAAANLTGTVPDDDRPVPGETGTSPDTDPLPEGTATALDGTFYDSWHTTSDSGGVDGWAPGDDSAAAIAALNSDALAQTMSISPDGRFLAYINANGDNVVVEVETNSTTVYPSVVDDFTDLCSEPQWTNDGRVLIDRGADKGDARYALRTPGQEDNVMVGAAPGCDAHPVVGPGGEPVVYSLDRVDGQVELLRTGVDNTPETTPVGAALADRGLAPRELVAVSPDGRFACLGAGEGSESWEPVLDRYGMCDTIMEIDTGEILDLKIEADGERTYWNGWASVFAVEGRLLIQYSDIDAENNPVWRLYDYRGEQLDETVPAYLPDHGEPVNIGFVPND